MADPQSLVAQVVSNNEESEQNDRSLSSYKFPSDPCPLVKRKRSSDPQDEDYVLEEEVYEHWELNVLILFYICSIGNDPLHSFLRIPLHVEVLEIYFLLRMKQL
jgi:hypothetical protein